MGYGARISSPAATRAKMAALEKAVELKLIDGCCIGDLDPRQMRTWLDETAERMKAARRRNSDIGKEE